MSILKTIIFGHFITISYNEYYLIFNKIFNKIKGRVIKELVVCWCVGIPFAQGVLTLIRLFYSHRHGM